MSELALAGGSTATLGSVGNEHTIEEWVPAEMSRTTVNGFEGHRAGGVDLNQVDFEDLVGLGVSVAQAARFISQRDLRGGIGSLSELDDFEGLFPAVREILRASGRA